IKSFPAVAASQSVQWSADILLGGARASLLALFAHSLTVGLLPDLLIIRVGAARRVAPIVVTRRNRGVVRVVRNQTRRRQRPVAKQRLTINVILRHQTPDARVDTMFASLTTNR